MLFKYKYGILITSDYSTHMSRVTASFNVFPRDQLSSWSRICSTQLDLVSIYTAQCSVSPKGVRGTLKFHKTSSLVPREMVDRYRKKYKYTSKYRENICPAIGNIEVISVC